MSSSEEVFNYDIPWFNVKLPLKQTTLQELATASISKEKLDQLFQEAQQIIDEEGQKYAGDKKGWYMQQFQERGTTSDRIAAAALKLSNTDFMLHMDSFALLFDVASKDSHHYESALKALAALWPKVLPARPLKRFAAQYFATLPEDEEKRKRVICYWFIEDSLKRTYAQFLAIAEGALKDNLVIRRECWLDTCGKLLNSVAELRGVMMALVVHKMGDPVSAISHKAYHLLLTMLTESSTNQGLLLTELEKLAFTRNCPPKTQRYCVNVMNQLVFNKGERKLAIKCVGSYLALFKHQVVNGCVEQGITNAIITGLRRAFPFAGSDVSSLDEHIDALFVLANTGPFLQRVSALAMVQQLTGKGWGQLETRFYRALYALLMTSPKSLPHSSQLTVFFTTLYKAVREDKNDARIAAFVHRLVQRCLYHSEAFICASLLLVGEVCKANSTARALLQKPKGNGEDQASVQALEKAAGLGSDDDDIEVFHDADKAPAYTKQPAKATKASKAAAADKKDEKTTANTAEKKYDPTGREPQYVRAQDEALWTLSCLSRHSHPAVVRLALLLAMGEETSYDMHPLDDLTFANFLDTFTDTAKEDRMSSAAAKNNKGVPVFRRAVHLSDMPRVSDPTFTRAAPRQIDVGHLFMHRYAVQRERFQTRKGDAAVWVSSTDDVDGDDAIDQATKISTNDALFGPSKADGSTAAKKAQMEEKKKKAAVAKKMADIDAEIEADAVAAIAAKKGKKSKAEAKRAREEEPEEDDGFSDNGEDLLDLEDDDDEADAADLDDEDVDDDAGDWGDAEGGDEYGDGMEDGMGGDDWQPDADAFDAMVTESAKAPSRKKQRQDEWERSREAPMRGRGGDRDFGGRGGGRGMGGRGGDRGRDFGGRGGGYSRGGDRGGRGGGGRDFGGRGGGYSRGGDRGGRGGRGGAPRGGRGRY